MTMPVFASKVVEYIAFASAVIGGGVWVGSVDTQGDSNQEAIAELRPVATETARDIATLEERTQHMQKSLDRVEAQQNSILEILQKR